MIQILEIIKREIATNKISMCCAIKLSLRGKLEAALILIPLATISRSRN